MQFDVTRLSSFTGT